MKFSSPIKLLSIITILSHLAPSSDARPLMQDPFFEPFFMEMGSRNTMYQFEEDGKNLVLTLEIPGIPKKDIKIHITEDYVLTVSANVESKTEKTSKEASAYQRSSRSFYQSLQLPKEIESSKISATLQDGVLKIVIPQKPKTVQQGRQIHIK